MISSDPPHGRDLSAVVDRLAHLKQLTPARIGLGRAGTAQPTAASLRFLLDHARARDAVHAALDFEAIAEALRTQGWAPIRVQSAAGDRTEYLRRPDLGRRLSPSGRSIVETGQRGSDVVVVAADGLSSSAISTNLLPTLHYLRPLLHRRRLTIGSLVLVEQGRVAIGDEIGELMGAKLALVLIGERPGLSAADSLGAYVTWRPRVGAMDSGRNCISNIRAAGLPPEEAASQIDDLIGRAFTHSVTGVRLNEMRFTEAAIPVTQNGGGDVLSLENGAAGRRNDCSRAEP
jgi:ethanolamine ammonia-lyase small subunit